MNELNWVNERLDRQIVEVYNVAEEMNVEAYKIRDMSGRFMLNELLIAKAQVLMTLANFVED